MSRGLSCLFVISRALSQPSQLVTDASVDPVVRLVVSILRLCMMETRALEARLQCSPEVGFEFFSIRTKNFHK